MIIETTLKNSGWVFNRHKEWVSPDGHLFSDKVDALCYNNLLIKHADEIATMQAALEAQSERIAALEQAINQAHSILQRMPATPHAVTEMARYTWDGINEAYTWLNSVQAPETEAEAPSVDAPKFKVGDKVRITDLLDEYPQGAFDTIIRYEVRWGKMNYALKFWDCLPTDIDTAVWKDCELVAYTEESKSE